MYVGGMHFQDNYNYDIERVKRCVIHYATPDGKVIPFCAYNTGPNFREEIEKKFAVPIEEWRGPPSRGGWLITPPRAARQLHDHLDPTPSPLRAAAPHTPHRTPLSAPRPPHASIRLH